MCDVIIRVQLGAYVLDEVPDEISLFATSKRPEGSLLIKTSAGGG